MKLNYLLEEPDKFVKALHKLAYELQGYLLDSSYQLDDVIIREESPLKLSISYTSKNLRGKLILIGRLVKRSTGSKEQVLSVEVATPQENIYRAGDLLGNSSAAAMIMLHLHSKDAFFTTFYQDVTAYFGVQLGMGTNTMMRKGVPKDWAAAIVIRPPFKLGNKMVHNSRDISHIEVVLHDDDHVSAIVYRADFQQTPSSWELEANSFKELVPKLTALGSKF